MLVGADAEVEAGVFTLFLCFFFHMVLGLELFWGGESGEVD